MTAQPSVSDSSSLVEPAVHTPALLSALQHPNATGLMLLRTTAIRMALRYAAIYALIMGVALAALRWTTSRHVDADLRRALEQDLAPLVAAYAHGQSEALKQALTRRANSTASEQPFSLLVGADGKKLAGNLLRWPRESKVALDGTVGSIWIEDNAIPIKIEDDEAYWPVIATRFANGERLMLARKVEQAGTLYDLTEYLFEVLSAAVVLALIMSVSVARAILRRMETIGLTAGNIMAGDLSRRVPLTNRRDEFDALATRLNAMLDRIQRLVGGLREVTDNIAHDLRSPLTRLRNRFEVTLLQPRDTAEYQQALQRGIEEVESLIGTFNALLSVAQAEAGHRSGTWGAVSLSDLAHDIVDFYTPLAEEKGQRLEAVVDATAPILGSRDLLAQALNNLLDNAIKYTPAGGRIHVRVEQQQESIVLAIADTGPGIAATEREHVLERFVRLESARHTPGAGLGLSLVRAVAHLHQAQLEMMDAAPGLILHMRFPAAAVEIPATRVSQA
jgi:signal transduction histidine kinase